MKNQFDHNCSFNITIFSYLFFIKDYIPFFQRQVSESKWHGGRFWGKENHEDWLGVTEWKNIWGWAFFALIAFFFQIWNFFSIWKCIQISIFWKKNPNSYFFLNYLQCMFINPACTICIFTRFSSISFREFSKVYWIVFHVKELKLARFTVYIRITNNISQFSTS